MEATSGVVLLVFASVAFLLANSPVSGSYTRFWKTAVSLQLGSHAFACSPSFVVARPLRIGALPHGIGYRHLVALGLVAGVGFTMSLFIAQLAFRDAELLSAAKTGVLVASGCAGIVSFVYGRWAMRA